MKFFISAGEESGEIYGARLAAEFKKLNPDVELAGIGGDRMKAEGVKIFHHVREMAAIGLIDILKKIFFFKKVLGEIKENIEKEEYDALILIDAPELNFRIGKFAYGAGVPVFYYVCPQLWAWRTYRANSLKSWVDTMLVLFPFEVGFYRQCGVKAEFLGHPMLDEIKSYDRESLRSELMPADCKKIVGLLPGSRNAEIEHILKPELEAADIIHSKMDDVGFVIPVAGSLDERKVLKAVGDRSYIKVIKGRSHEVMAASDMLITKSGTSTLEGAIFGVPMVIVYRGPFISYWFARILAHVEFIGLPNIIAGKKVATEYLQSDFKAGDVAKEVLGLLSDEAKLIEKREALKEVRQKLGKAGAAKRAAIYIIDHKIERKR